jgi:hypothetical protein
LTESGENSAVSTDEKTNGSTDQLNGARSELLGEAIADVQTRARNYLQEPAEAAWHNLVEALTRTYGDSETYDLLRAVAIHARTSGR